MGQDIEPVETIRTKAVGPGVRIGLVICVALVAVAVAKPWALLAPELSPTPTPDRVLSASAGVEPGPSGSIAASTATPIVKADPICPSPDGWRVVIDDVEFGKAVRTWLVPTAFYMSAQQPPALTRRDVSTFVSASVRQLAFCAPPDPGGRPPVSWSGELWYLPGFSTTIAPQLVGSLASAPGGFSAVVRPTPGPVGWPSGLYLLEADVYPATSPLWVPIVLAAPQSA